MFAIFRKIFSAAKEIKNLRYQVESLKCDLQQALAITERYMTLFKTTDKIQLLILRRSLWTKK